MLTVIVVNCLPDVQQDCKAHAKGYDKGVGVTS